MDLLAPTAVPKPALQDEVLMDGDRWFDTAREAYSIAWQRLPPLEDFLSEARPVTQLDIEYGARLGLLPKDWQESDAVELASPEPGDSPWLDRNARLLWLSYVLMGLIDWWERNGDPEYELPPLLTAWELDGITVWTSLQPRGLDAVYFGIGARRRLLRRLTRWCLDAQRGVES